MARRIRSTEEAAGESTQEAVPENGVCFGNNHPNRIFHTAKGVSFKFQGTRQYFTEPDQIAVLKKLAEDPNSRVFLLEQEVEEAAAAQPESSQSADSTES